MNKKLYLSLLVLLSIFLTGCTMNEIEEYAIVSGIGIDYEENKFIVTYEIYKENNGQTTSLTSIVKSSEGKSISDAVNNINNKLYQIPYLNHTLLIVLGENLINKKFNETLNYLIHDVRIRSSCYIVGTNQELAKDMLENSQNINQVVSYNIYKKIDQKPSQVSIWNNCNFDYIMNEKIDINGVVVFPIVKYNEDFDLTKAYIIKNDNTVLIADMLDVFIIQLFTNSVNEGLVNVNNKFIYLKSVKTKIRDTENVVKMNVDMQFLSYDDLGIDLNNAEQKLQLINNLKTSISSIINDIFIKYQNNEVDPFYIYKYLERNNHALYKKIKNDYYSYFKEIKLEVNLQIDLLTSGLSEERV